MKPNAPKKHVDRLAGFPAKLRELIEAELAAGNEIVEIASCHPAPPVGAYVKLANPVSTRLRASGDGLDFYDRNSSIYSGEFTDEKRFFFVLEPPRPPEPEPDMDAIRAGRQPQVSVPEKRERGGRTSGFSEVAPGFSAPEPAAQTAVQRFERSMIIDDEKWHDGIGYDLETLRSASPEERNAIESLLLSRGVDDWRDVEALAEFDTPKAQEALWRAMKSSDHQIRAAVIRHAPALVPAKERTASLVRALQSAEFYAGLTEALDEAEDHHPPEVIEALFRGALFREGDAAVHFAAMLMFIHGKAKVAFDWKQRPFYLCFNTPDRAAREAVFRELCDKTGVKAGDYLKVKSPPSNPTR